MYIRFLSRLIASGVIILGLATVATSQGSGWSVSIVSASSEEPEYTSGDTWPGRPEGHRWVKLIVQLTSPGKDVKLPAAQIQLSDDAGSYSVTAIGHQVGAKDSIVYLPLLVLTQPHKDLGMKKGAGKLRTGGGWSSIQQLSPDRRRLEAVATGFFKDMDPKKMLFSVELKGASGGRELRLVKSPLNVVLLFAVPDGAANLKLRVGDAPPLVVPAVQ